MLPWRRYLCTERSVTVIHLVPSSLARRPLRATDSGDGDASGLKDGSSIYLLLLNFMQRREQISLLAGLMYPENS